MNVKAEQMSLFDQDTWFGRTYQEHSAPIKEKTSVASLKRQPKSSKKMPIYLDLRRGGGHTQDASSWSVGVSLGSCTIVSGGAFLNAGNEFVYSLTSTDGQQPTYYLLLNTGEQPREPNPTVLSDILVPSADPKYNLSVKACQGILSRASRRGKELPEILRKALENQANEEDR